MEIDRIFGTVLLPILLMGCAGHDLVKRAEPQTVSITWVRALPQECNGAANHPACAVRSAGYTHCLIIMPENAAPFVMAEEFLHCFGWEHK